MRRRMMKSKIHRATITHADLEYEGSVTIDVHPKTELQGLQVRHRRQVHEQQPGHHALYVFVHQHGRCIHQHRTLNPFTAQMQMADRPFFGEIDFGKFKCLGFCHGDLYQQAAQARQCITCIARSGQGKGFNR